MSSIVLEVHKTHDHNEGDPSLVDYIVEEARGRVLAVNHVRCLQTGVQTRNTQGEYGSILPFVYRPVFAENVKNVGLSMLSM